MNPPKHEEPYVDRHVDCQTALRPYMDEVLERATAMGWSREESINAIATLMVDYLAGERDPPPPEFPMPKVLGRFRLVAPSSRS